VRMANAINATAAVTDRTVTGQTTYTPWLTARAGSEFGLGQVVVRQPTVEATTMEVLLSTISSTAPYQLFINNVVRASASQISALTRLFPSRALISYDGFPELFDDPFGVAGDGDSAVDINAADGQEVVGARPFFGASSFGPGATETKVIVFKTASIYQLDLVTKQYQEIKQPYGGCTAPDSICQTKDGIMFANASGIYRLNKDLTVTPVGELQERNWKQDVNQDYLYRAAGHNFREDNKYKLSVPYGADQETNNYVFVYDHTGEGKKTPYGPWVRHTNFAATTWANIGRDSLFGTTDGQVFRMRNSGDVTDYRDDATAIAMEIITRTEDFDMPGTNKIVSGVLIEFHNDAGPVEGVQVSTACDSEVAFQNSDALSIASSTKSTESAWFSLARRKCARVQVKIACSTIDNPVVVASMAYRVAPLDSKGTPEAKNL